MKLLRTEAEQLVTHGLKANTRRTYSSAQRQYIDFCNYYSLAPMPANEDQLLTYVAYLNRRNLSPSTMSVYLAAVRAMHISAGHADPLQCCLRLKQALRSISMEHAAPKQKLPLTLDILARMQPSIMCTYNKFMLWTAVTLGYFGLLRAGEYCVTQGLFDPKKHLCLGDIVVNNSYIILWLKMSKTDICNNGVSIYIGCSKNCVCSVCSMLKYLPQRASHFGENSSSPLFLFADGTPLTRSLLNSHLKDSLAGLGFDPDGYSGHSLRAGGATDAANHGFAEWEIKLLGRWSSDAYQRYIRSPLNYRVDLARRMVGN